MFPMPKLLLTIAQDEMSTKETLRLVKPFLERIRDNEYVKRTMLADLGVKNTERINIKVKKGEQEDEYECEVCSENLYVSYVSFNRLKDMKNNFVTLFLRFLGL